MLDAATGEFISAEKIAKVTWAERIDAATGRPVENPGIRYQGKPDLFEMWPGPQGAHSWLPQAFSPRTGLVYIPIMELGALIGPPAPGVGGFTAAMGVTLIPDADLPESRRSFLKAWDPVAQKAAWTVELPGDWPGGVLATAGDLVFQGAIDGQLVGYDAKTGKKVWSFKTAAPVVATPISYGVNGRQYVTVLTGSGSQGGGILATGNAAYRTDYRLPRQVLTFAIGGAESLPPFELPAASTAIGSGFHSGGGSRNSRRHGVREQRLPCLSRHERDRRRLRAGFTLLADDPRRERIQDSGQGGDAQAQWHAAVPAVER